MLRLIQTPAKIGAVGGAEAVTVSIAREFQDPRLELIRLLHESCEIEHALMLQYLYGAFSLKPVYSDVAGVPDPSRSDCLLGIAVQEMHHFRDVNRMLVAFGGQPNMVRQGFPYEPQIYPFEMKLERLTRSSVAKYVYAEAPASGLVESEQKTELDRGFVRDVLAELRPEARFNHIGTLYQTVLSLFDELTPASRPDGLDEMRQTINHIKNDGEVAHFTFFKTLFMATAGSLKTIDRPWDDPASERYPSFDVPANPSALAGHESEIQDPRLLAIAQLGNFHYWIILTLLHLSYASEGDGALASVAVTHMASALFPLSEAMSRAQHGMPFDPLSMGYSQGVLDRQFALWLLQEAETKAKVVAQTDPALAAACSRIIAVTIAALQQNSPASGGDSHERAVIIGAGPAGLAAACALATRGIPTLLLEKASIVGGKVQSYRLGGLSIEHGVHGWWMNYLNFNRLLEQVGVNLQGALKEAEGSNIAMRSGVVYPLRNFKFDLPSPLHLILQTFRAPYLSLIEVLGFTRFAIHLLAFRHETDYLRYDSISFQELMDDMHVPARVQQMILTPFILSFDFAAPSRVSAACGLSGSQFYIVHDQNSILARWSRGLPADTIFGPIADFVQRIGGQLLLGCPAQSVSIDNNCVRAVKYHSASAGPSISAPVGVVASVPAASVPSGDFVRVETTLGPVWLTQETGAYRALNARCTHQGCSVNWMSAAQEFQCPCHGGRYDAKGQVIQGPPPLPLEPLVAQLQGSVVQLMGQASAHEITCCDVVIATDTHAAQELLHASAGVRRELTDAVDQLDTTPVIVVRLWFDKTADIPAGLESAITPDAEFVDNFFDLNDFSDAYAREGKIIEVQSYRVDQWLDRPDSDILDVVFRDLSGFLPRAPRDKMKQSHIQRHLALFTKYAPGRAAIRPGVQSGVEGLYLAGDWTECDTNVWMMERAIVSGLRAANAVLTRRGMPLIQVVELAGEGLLLRFARRVSKRLRQMFWRNYPEKEPKEQRSAPVQPPG